MVTVRNGIVIYENRTRSGTWNRSRTDRLRVQCSGPTFRGNSFVRRRSPLLVLYSSAVQYSPLDPVRSTVQFLILPFTASRSPS